ncbi:MAG: outer membrane protein assembly factor BamC [Candidatus Sedimenticola sp. (ex Thyasira tokunagai)]
MSVKFSNLLVTPFLAAVVVGCGSMPNTDDVLPDRKVEYKRASLSGSNLEIPPDLTKSSINDALEIPDAPNAGATTLSGVMAREQIQGRVATRTQVMPTISDMEVRRDGDQRWLVIQGSVDDVWFRSVEFWQDNGVLLVEQDPTIGVMVTDWLENREDISSDIVTDTVRRVFDGIYSASTRDKYRVRIERGAEESTTELYLTHRGMQETILEDTSGKSNRIVWNPRETDHGLEAEMLRRLMVHMGIADQQASRSLARKGTVDKNRSTLIRSADQVSLKIDESPSRAWRLTGVALDRVGFAVEDRDRSKGIYFVRYNDPMKDADEPGLLSKLAFWKDNDSNIDKSNQYQVSLQPEGKGTRVVVLNKGGVRDSSETALRILTLLNEQIK